MTPDRPTLIPRHPVLRVVATIWLLAAIVMLVYTLLRPETQADDRAALTGLVPLYFLSLPLGHAGVMALSRLKVELYTGSGAVLGLYAEALILWAALAALGWLQWFVLLPWIARRCRRVTDFLFRRFFAR
jgi:hypothetical protein